MGSAGVTFEGALVHLAALVACSVAGWLLVVTVVAVVAGRLAPTSQWTRRAVLLTPRIWRDVVLTCVGVTALSAPVLASAQADAPSGGESRPHSATASLSGLPLPDRPSSTTRVTVRRGDTLWSLAAAALPPGAGDAEVARGCARWYAANRQVIGPDPDLILPGMSLTPPSELPLDERSL